MVQEGGRDTSKGWGMPPLAWPKIWVGRLRDISTDGDSVMALNRLLAGLVSFPFNLRVATVGGLGSLPVILDVAYIFSGFGLWLHHRLFPRHIFWRRAVALPLDVLAGSYELHIGGAATAWVFPAYLWIIFGNGFRFGSDFLLAAMALSIVSFAVVAGTTQFWIHAGSMATGVIVGLIILPLYALALIRRLSIATRLAEAASRAKSLFLASVSHELRTPLNAIIGMGALLEGTPLKPDQAEMSETILTAARSLLRLIDGILDLSRIEAERMPVTAEDFDLALVLGELRTILLTQARQKGLYLHVHLTSRTPLLLHGDARRLHEILLNLVGNALKFTHLGGITIAVDATEWTEAAVRLRVEVTDTGIGIAPEAQARIFENFTQADETILNRYGGTGLGLAITRKFVELLGGTIGVRSSPGAGSTFWFNLPLASRPGAAVPAVEDGALRAFVPGTRAGEIAPLLGRLRDAGVRIEAIDTWPEGTLLPDAADGPCVAFAAAGAESNLAQLAAVGALSFVAIDDARATGSLPAAWQRAFAQVLPGDIADDALAGALHFLRQTTRRGAGRNEAIVSTPAGPSLHVLVADDNTVNQRVLQRIFGGAGHKVRVVGDGEAALDALADQRFDIALFDVNMPKIDGIEATKIYRMASLGADEVPIVALTADAMEETRISCLEAGMKACLVKPVEPARLLEIIGEIARAARTGEALAPAAPDRPVAVPAAEPTLDVEVVDNLLALGGTEFLAEIGTGFHAEAEARLDGLRAALARGDVSDFRFQAHGLRSIAANLGARALSDLCLPYQGISAEDLRLNGMGYLGRIAEELGRVERALTAHGVPRKTPQLSLLEMLPPTTRRSGIRRPGEVAGPTAA